MGLRGGGLRAWEIDSVEKMGRWASSVVGVTAEAAEVVRPKFRSRTWKSRKSACPSPLKSPCSHTRAGLPKFAERVVKSAVLTVPFASASPGRRLMLNERVAPATVPAEFRARICQVWGPFL